MNYMKRRMFNYLTRWSKKLLPILFVILLIVCFGLFKDRYDKKQSFLGLLSQNINSCIVSIESSASLDTVKISKISEKVLKIHHTLEHGTLFLNPHLDYMGRSGDFEYIYQLLISYSENGQLYSQDYLVFLDNLKKSLKELQQAALADMNTAGMKHIEFALSEFYSDWNLANFHSSIPSPYPVLCTLLVSTTPITTTSFTVS